MPPPAQDSLPAGGLRLYREGVEPSGSLRKVSGYIHPPFQDFACRKVRLRQTNFRWARTGLGLRRAIHHRVAISNNRLVGIEEGKVRFRWKDYRNSNRRKTMTLAADEFIRRFLLHVLPKGFQRIRYYGFLANRYCEQKLARCRQLLAIPQPEPPDDQAARIIATNTRNSPGLP